MRQSILFVILLGCTGANHPDNGPPAPAPLPTAPWSDAALNRASVPEVYYEQWSRAANRANCALLAFSQVGPGASATPRAATFSGGWGVAYDLPTVRSAFGVAGTGSAASDSTYSWPYNRRWSDGSSAGYGPEGGSGPNQLAYLRVAGQSCLYNVWSRLGREHLELLLESLRYVK